MAHYEIKKLEDLLGSEIVSVSTSNLTSAGDNYGSAIFSVIVTIKDGENEKEVLAVAKMLPRNDLLQKVFNSQKTFPNEVGYYEKIAPCLRNFQKEQGLNGLSSYPDFYGARISLDPSKDKVDTDAVLLIKNINGDGFSILDRRLGFDLDQSKLILDKLAELHATVIGLKTLKPEAFDENLKQFFTKFDMFESKGDGTQRTIDSILELLQEDEFCVRNLKIIRERLEYNTKFAQKKNHEDFQKTPFVSFAHCDLWTNNIMIKIINDKPVDVKFVDYQFYEYSSVTRDVVFFLFTSVQLPILRNHVDGLLVYYFERFVEWLAKLKCDTSIYKFEDFLEEMGSFVKRCEFLHIMVMLKPMYALAKNTKDVNSIKREDFLDNSMGLAEGCKPRAYFIVQELMRREWIQM